MLRLGRFRLSSVSTEWPGCVWMMDGREWRMREMSGWPTALEVIDHALPASGQRGFLLQWMRPLSKVSFVFGNSQGSQRVLLPLIKLTWRHDSKGHQQEMILKWPLGSQCEIRYLCCIFLKATFFFLINDTN